MIRKSGNRFSEKIMLKQGGLERGGCIKRACATSQLIAAERGPAEFSSSRNSLAAASQRVLKPSVNRP
jgi:hypothetical protein